MTKKEIIRSENALNSKDTFIEFVMNKKLVSDVSIVTALGHRKDETQLITRYDLPCKNLSTKTTRDTIKSNMIKT